MTRKLMTDGKAVEVEACHETRKCVIRLYSEGKEVSKQTLRLENAIVLRMALEAEIERSLKEWKGELMAGTYDI